MAAKRAPKKPTPRIGLVTDPDAPPMIQGVSLALGVLKVAKMSRWDDLVEALTSGNELVAKNLSAVYLTEQQQRLIADYEPILAYVRAGTTGKAACRGVPAVPGEKGVTVARCPVCELFIFTSGTTPTHCTMRDGCTGKPVKASPASKEKPAVAA